ncbi:SCO family protein [Paracoccus pacificus]|uniref:SCO family protein n=1 Tax=Paracoccus pacificus TaxID=1463598 RepID=A0ABW4R7A7_9RHOB
MLTGILTTLLLLLGGWLLLQKRNSGDPSDRFAQCREGVIAGGAGAIGGSFELVNMDGATVTEKQVFTKPSLLYFGYTQCPDVCPLDNNRNSMAAAILQEKGKDVQPVFVTIDPKRDTLDVMRDYSEGYDPKLVGLTGTAEQVKAAADAWRVYFNARDDGTDPYYLVDHSTQTYLVLPGDNTVEFFNRDVTPEQMAERVGCFLDVADS